MMFSYIIEEASVHFFGEDQKAALFTETVILIELPPSGSNHIESTTNHPFNSPLPLTKKEPYFEPDDSWLVVDLLNHRPEQIQIRDPANNKVVTTAQTSPNEIFLEHGDVFSPTQVLPKVHILLGGLVRYEDLRARGDKPLNVKSLAQTWLDELSTLIASGNSPFTIEQDEALASLINRQAAPLLNLPVKPIDEQSAFRPDEKIGVFFYHLLALLNKTDFITAKQRMGACGADESEGAIVDIPQRNLALKSLLAIRHSEGQDKADYAYRSDKLAKIANYYSVSALTSDGTGDDNDLESKLKAEVKQATEHDQLTDIESLYFNAIKLLKHLREPGIIRHVETRREYQLKTTKLDYRYIELKQLDFISLKLHRNYRYQISSADNSVQLVGRFNPSDNVNVKIPAKWSSIEIWNLTATPVENDFVDALFPSLKSQYQNMLSIPGFTVGEGDVGIVHANLIAGADESLRNLSATMQVAGGMMSLYLAAAIGATGVGAPLAGAIGFIGLDNLQAGIRTLTLNEATATYGAKFLEWAGVPKGYGELVYGMVDISVITKAGYSIKAINQVYNIVKVKPVAGLKPQQMVKPENISVTVENITKNKPHVIDLKNADELAVKSRIIDGAAGEKPILKVKIEYIPEKFYLNQTSHVSGGNNLCGPTTCAMIISDNKGNIVNLDTVVKQFENIRPTGVNVYEMNHVLLKNGISSEATITLTTEQLKGLTIKNQSTIVGVRAGEGGHFIIVDSYKNIDGVGYYMIRDPYKGALGIRADILENNLNHNGVILK